MSENSNSLDDTCYWSGCEQEATHIVNWTTERRREWLCDEHTGRQQDSFQSEIQVKEREVHMDTNRRGGSE